MVAYEVNTIIKTFPVNLLADIVLQIAVVILYIITDIIYIYIYKEYALHKLQLACSVNYYTQTNTQWVSSNYDCILLLLLLLLLILLIFFTAVVDAVELEGEGG